MPLKCNILYQSVENQLLFILKPYTCCLTAWKYALGVSSDKDYVRHGKAFTLNFVQGGRNMLKLSLKEGEYLNIGDNIRVVYVGSNGKNGRFLIDAPRELNIVRSKIEANEERKRNNYYPDPEISEQAQKEIQRIIWKEKQKKAGNKQAD